MAGFPQWILGVILIILGSLGNNLGSNLVSLGHKETTESTSKKNNDSDSPSTAATSDPIEKHTIEEENVTLPSAKEETGTASEEKKDEGIMSWRIIGVLVFVFGNLFTFASFGFGAQSLIASLESIQFVSNLVFAKYCHNETVTRRMMIATVSIVVGNVLVVIFAEHHAILYDSDGMIELYKTNTAYHVYLVFAFVLWGITNYVYRLYHHRRVTENTLMWKHSFIEPFCFAVSSAIVGTQAVLNSKCMSMLIQVTLRGRKQEFGFWYLYFIVITWIMMVSYWLHRLDRGLALFPPLFIIPVMQVFFVFFAILCGGIYFKEFISFGAGQWVGFIIGVSMILGGVYGLAPTDMILQTPTNQVAPLPQLDNFLDFSKTATQADLESNNVQDSQSEGVPVNKAYEAPVQSFETPDKAAQSDAITA